MSSQPQHAVRLGGARAGVGNAPQKKRRDNMGVLVLWEPPKKNNGGIVLGFPSTRKKGVDSRNNTPVYRFKAMGEHRSLTIWGHEGPNSVQDHGSPIGVALSRDSENTQRTPLQMRLKPQLDVQSDMFFLVSSLRFLKL